jgi:hypothetical protein
MLPLRPAWVLALLFAGTAWSQDAAPSASGPAAPSVLSVLEQAARQKTATWQKLAQGLDASILQLLPCDPKATAAITEVSKASEARGAAVIDYLQETGKQAALQTAAARRALLSIQPLGAEFSEEKADVAQEQAGVSGQAAGLMAASGGAQPKPAFSGAQAGLQRIAALQKQRSDAADSGVNHAVPAAFAVQELVSQLESRESSIKATRAAFETESARWSAYYAARLARAQTECAATKGFPAAKPQGKQK